MIEISLCMAVWNTSHLLKRSIETIANQSIDPSRYEVIIIDDNSYDDVKAAVAGYENKINLRVVRLEHNYGMRGNTVSFNTAFSMAEAPVLAETTPECLLPHDALEQMLLPHDSNKRQFVALKVYPILPPMQLMIDTVDWRSDIMNVSKLAGWDDPWVQNNVSNTRFGTHQICSIRKDTFYEVTNGHGFPLYADYGTEDPMYSGARDALGIGNVTLPNSCMAIHQWHPPFQYWMGKGYGPMLNKWAHSMSNYLGDTSGKVPEGGTCTIWDSGSHEMLPMGYYSELDELQILAGVSEQLVHSIKS